MNNSIPQFGEPFPGYEDRASAYTVVFNDAGLLLVLLVDGEYHLPGGGIDPGEDPIEAISRESMEEAGAIIGDIEYIGEANQFIDDMPWNKLGVFYKAKLISIDTSQSVEADHRPVWITTEEFLNGNSPEFQKWAVNQS